jgi:hypothetical protein
VIKYLGLVSLLASSAASATECGELRLAVAHLKAAAAIEESLHHAAPAFTARSQLKQAEGKIKSACAPRKANIAALPLGYVSVPPGNLSKITVEPTEAWHLQFTTRAGAKNGLVFAEPATLELPEGLKWETEVSASSAANELLIAVATDAVVTVEEPAPGKGSWRIEAKAKPALVPLSKLRACAGGKGDAGLKLGRAACALLAGIDPVAQPGALPDRGRAVPLGEWQFGYRGNLELGAEELSEPPSRVGATRVDLPLELSAPLPGVSDGKQLLVTLEANTQDKPDGALLKLGHGGCGDDDEKCEQARFAVEVWYDRAFGVPFLRVPPPGPLTGALTGKVTDRLARPVTGQRVLVTASGRRVITVTDDHGDFRFDALQAGDASVVPVGKLQSNTPKGDETRAVKVGMEALKVPVIFVNKLYE